MIFHQYFVNIFYVRFEILKIKYYIWSSLLKIYFYQRDYILFNYYEKSVLKLFIFLWIKLNQETIFVSSSNIILNIIKL